MPERLKPRRLGRAGAAGLLAVVLAACSAVVNPVSGRRELTVVSEAEELKIGEQALEVLRADPGLVDAPALRAYVDGVGQRLARASHRPGLRWRFEVLDTPEVNAFALPGGTVVITRGLLAMLRDEAELAAVLGHEIAHVAARHAAQRMTRARTAETGTWVATALGSLVGLGPVAAQLSSGWAAGSVAAYGRDQEMEADRLGADYLRRDGQDPRRMADVIATLQRAEKARQLGSRPPTAPAWLSSHPAHGARREALGALEPGPAGPDRAEADAGRARHLEALEGLVWGDSPVQGVRRGQDYLHEGLGLGLTLPEGWTLLNRPDHLQIAPPRGRAGMVVKLAPRSAGPEPRAALQALYQPTLKREEPFMLHGRPALRVLGQRQDKGKTVPFEATVVELGGGTLLLLLPYGFEPAELAAARVGLHAIESSVRPLSAEERRRAQPWRLRSTILPPGGWPELARTSPLPPAEAEPLLRLINGADPLPGETRPAPRPGDRVKTLVGG